jgi:hypothetical protein
MRDDDGSPWARWLVGGVALGVVAAAVVAFVLASVLAGLIILVAGAVATTGAALVLGVLRA